MDVFDKILKEYSWKFPKGYPDINDPKDKEFLISIVEELVTEEETDLDELRNNLDSIIRNISDPEDLKQITKYAKNLGFGKQMKTHLSSKNLSTKDILFFQSLLSDLGKTGEFAKIAENPPTFDLNKSNYFDQIPGFDSAELTSLYNNMKDSIQGTVSLGPGEAFLSVFFNNVEKAKSKGDLMIDGKEIELKSRTGSTGALVAPKYVVRGKADDLIKEMEKLIGSFNLENEQKESIKNLIRPKGTSWPYKINTLYQAGLEAGLDKNKLAKDLSKEISSWYKNKLDLNFESYFNDNEFESKNFIYALAKKLAQDYFKEHGFDGFMISDNKGNFKYYEGDSFIDAIGNDIIVTNPSDLVPRLKV